MKTEIKNVYKLMPDFSMSTKFESSKDLYNEVEYLFAKGKKNFFDLSANDIDDITDICMSTLSINEIIESIINEYADIETLIAKLITEKKYKNVFMLSIDIKERFRKHFYSYYSDEIELAFNFVSSIVQNEFFDGIYDDRE